MMIKKKNHPFQVVAPLSSNMSSLTALPPCTLLFVFDDPLINRNEVNSSLPTCEVDNLPARVSAINFKLSHLEVK